MLNGICLLPVIPMRKTKSDKSEMINQVLFGETFKILVKTTKWIYIELHHDQYKGWIDNKQCHIFNHTDFSFRTSNKKHANIKINSIIQPLIIGSLIPIEQTIKKQLKITENLDFCTIKPVEKWLVKIAKKYLNTPYLWGGRSTLGIDCSGYTQMVYRFFNIQLPRDAYQQAKKGRLISNIKNTKTGDLAFFESKKSITHVGIILEKNNIIHASGKVRIDDLDEHGILNKKSKSYTHKLKCIKRIL